MQDINMEPLGIADEDWAVTQQIESCPSTMMMRELVMNGIEAAQSDPSGKGFVVIDSIYTRESPNVKKLRIINNGVGLNKTELFTATKLAGSVNKKKGHKRNYGRGGKVASLQSNTNGFRIRSCKNGVCHQVLLYGVYDEEREYTVYGRYNFPVGYAPDGSHIYDPVPQVEAEYLGDDPLYSKTTDWTEVVLMGNSDNQPTALAPYGKASDRQWLAHELYMRFYRIPENVSIILSGEANRRGNESVFVPWGQRHDAFRKHMGVKLSNGVIIHYYDDPRRSSGEEREKYHPGSSTGALCSFRSTCCLVYRDEMYDVHTGKEWGNESAKYGITHGSQDISIFIELPDDYPVRPSPDRDRLITCDGEREDENSQPVEAQDFAYLVLTNMPQYFRDLVRSYDTHNNNDILNDVTKELQKLLNEKMKRKQGPKVSDEGNVSVNDGENDGAGNTTHLDRPPRPDLPPYAPKVNPPTPSPSRINNPQKRVMVDLNGIKQSITSPHADAAPKFTVMTPEEVENFNLQDKAGKFEPDVNLVYLNPWYSAWTDAEAELRRLYSGHPDGEYMREKVSEAVEEMMSYIIGRSIVFAKWKEGREKWGPSAIKSATSPESLSIVADGWEESISRVKQAMSRKFKAYKTNDKAEAA